MWPGIHDMPYKYENNMLTWEKKEVKTLIIIPEWCYYIQYIDIQALTCEQTLQVPQMDEHGGP